MALSDEDVPEHSRQVHVRVARVHYLLWVRFLLAWPHYSLHDPRFCGVEKCMSSDTLALTPTRAGGSAAVHRRLRGAAAAHCSRPHRLTAWL